MSDSVSRRKFMSSVGAAATLGATLAPKGTDAQEVSNERPLAEAVPPSAGLPAEPGALFFFTETEARFVHAAVDRLIPEDDDWPGAAWAGVMNFIDRQLAGGYGAGARMYLQGPWEPEAPPQFGYQLRYTPAELYRIGIRETLAAVRARWEREFWELDLPEMDEVLAALESGALDLPTIPPTVFFETLLANTVEGWFADPAYGGNRDMVAWRMVGFPGAYAQYVDLIELYDTPYTRPPISMTDRVAHARHIEVPPSAGVDDG